MKLHGRDSYVVILIPETADLLGCGEVAGLVGRIRHPGKTQDAKSPPQGAHYHEDSFFHSRVGKFK